MIPRSYSQPKPQPSIEPKPAPELIDVPVRIYEIVLVSGHALPFTLGAADTYCQDDPEFIVIVNAAAGLSGQTYRIRKTAVACISHFDSKVQRPKAQPDAQ